MVTTYRWSHVEDAGCPEPSADRGCPRADSRRLAELDAGQKFWWMDWNRMIRDPITAMRTGEPVLYDDE